MFVRNSEYPLCRHTKTNGLRCKSPALTTSAFCFHHQKRRRTQIAGPGFSTGVLHPLHNAGSIQQALAMVLTGLAANTIHPKVGGKMVYALQQATANLRKSYLE